MWPEVGRERQSESEAKRLRRGVGEGWREWPVDTGQQRDQLAWDRVQELVREQQSRWVGIPSSFVEILLEIHASVSLHMHIGNAMLHNFSYCAWINPRLIVRLLVCSFSPAPLIVFLVAMKKCAMPLSEPLVDHRPRREMVRRSLCIWGAEGVLSHCIELRVCEIFPIHIILISLCGFIFLFYCFFLFFFFSFYLYRMPLSCIRIILPISQKQLFTWNESMTTKIWENLKGNLSISSSIIYPCYVN